MLDAHASDFAEQVKVATAHRREVEMLKMDNRALQSRVKDLEGQLGSLQQEHVDLVKNVVMAKLAKEEMAEEVCLSNPCPRVANPSPRVARFMERNAFILTNSTTFPSPHLSASAPARAVQDDVRGGGAAGGPERRLGPRSDAHFTLAVPQ